MPEPIRITSLRDLDEACAEHCMGWKWLHVFADERYEPLDNPLFLRPEDFEHLSTCRIEDNCMAGTHGPFAPITAYSTDPVASYALETKMRELGYFWTLTTNVWEGDGKWFVRAEKLSEERDDSVHASRFVAMSLAALAALGVELELIEGWDKCN